MHTYTSACMSVCKTVKFVRRRACASRNPACTRVCTERINAYRMTGVCNRSGVSFAAYALSSIYICIHVYTYTRNTYISIYTVSQAYTYTRGTANVDGSRACQMNVVQIVLFC